MSSMTIGSILRNNVKEKLERGEVVASMTVRLVRQVEIAQIAKTAGFDTIYVDMEHCSASIETTSQICMAALAAGIAPFVRVPANTPEYITRVLEGGALGVIAPHIGSAEEARAVVQSAPARLRAGCPTCISAAFRPPRRTLRSTTPPW